MKIYYQNKFDQYITEVAFVENRGDRRTAFNFVSGTAEDIREGTPIPKEGIMKIPTDLFNEIVKGFAEIANEKGLKLDSDMKREGQLEATKYHLEDMRKLLKLNS